jgi:hypothetical protein
MPAKTTLTPIEYHPQRSIFMRYLPPPACYPPSVMAVMPIVVLMLAMEKLQRTTKKRQSLGQRPVRLVQELSSGQERIPRRPRSLRPIPETTGVLAIVLDPMGQQHPQLLHLVRSFFHPSQFLFTFPFGTPAPGD